MTTKQKVNYQAYITSKEWRTKHVQWLKQADYRCMMFPWIKVGKGKHYHCHHTNYKNLGEEEYGRDIIVLSPFAHKHIIHGVLSGYKRPRQQKEGYPNGWQVLAHAWCRMPHPLKLILPLAFMSMMWSFLRFLIN